MPGKQPEVVVLDNRLDTHFGNLPRWFADAHANLAGYYVIADDTAKFLAPIIRGKSKRHVSSPVMKHVLIILTVLLLAPLAAD
jgi:hypothetical protein